MSCDIRSDEYLFDPDLLCSIDFRNSTVEYRCNISPVNPGPDFELRPLKLSDFHKGYLNVLSQLTVVGDVTQETFESQFRAMKSSNAFYYITVIENTKEKKIIGSATLLVERKFVHSAALRGLIEDVVVLDEYRGRDLGKLLVHTMTELGRKMGCYKVVLSCKENVKSFYAQFGYVSEGNQYLSLRYKY